MSAVDRWVSTPVRWAITAAGIGIVMTLVAAPHATGYAAAAGVALVVLVLGGQRFVREQRAGQTDPAADPLTADEARALAEDLSLQLYRAQDALGFVAEMCDIADEHRGVRGEPATVTTVRVREWLRGAQCAREAGLVLDPDASGQDPDPIRTTPDTTGQGDADQGGHDPDALRTRLAAAIWERQNPGRKYADCAPPWNADAESDADAVLAELAPELDRLRKAERAANLLAGSHRRAEQADAALDRVEEVCHHIPFEHASRILAALDGPKTEGSSQ